MRGNSKKEGTFIVIGSLLIPILIGKCRNIRYYSDRKL